MKFKKLPLKNKTLGILGGIGPEASAVFYAKLIEKIQEMGLVKQNIDFPKIIINSIPAPELFGNISDLKKVKYYSAGLKELDKFNTNTIAIVCNTAHRFYNKLTKDIKSPVINLVEEVKNKVNAKKEYLLLATSTTIQSKIYNLENVANVSFNDSKIIDKIIFDYNKGSNKKSQQIKLLNIINKYLKFRKFILLIGCTELSLLLNDTSYNKLDGLDILVDSTINFLSNSKKGAIAS